MKSLGKLVRGAHASGRNWKVELSEFLRAHRSTSHTATKVPPSVLLFGRNNNSKIPSINESYTNIKDLLETAKTYDLSLAEKAREYGNKRLRCKSHRFSLGDEVLLRQQKRNKTTSALYTEPLKITKMNGTMVWAENKSRTVTRNVSYFKLLIRPEAEPERAGEETLPANTDNVALTPARPRIEEESSATNDQTCEEESSATSDQASEEGEEEPLVNPHLSSAESEVESPMAKGAERVLRPRKPVSYGEKRRYNRKAAVPPANLHGTQRASKSRRGM